MNATSITILLAFFSGFSFNFHDSSVEEALYDNVGYYKVFSEDEKESFCASGDELACFFLYIENEKYASEDAETDINNLFDGRNREIASYFAVYKNWKNIPSDEIAELINSSPHDLAKGLKKFYLKKLYLEGKYDLFDQNYTPIRDSELFTMYIKMLFKSNPEKALNVLTQLDSGYGDSFYISLMKLSQNYYSKLKTTKLRKKFKIWKLYYNFLRIRYRVVINQSRASFSVKIKSSFDWQAALFRAMSYTRRREHSNAVKVYRKMAKKIDKFDLSPENIFNFYRWYGYSLGARGKTPESMNKYIEGNIYFTGRDDDKASLFLYHAADMARLDNNIDKADELYTKLRANYKYFDKISIADFLHFWINYKDEAYTRAVEILNEIISTSDKGSYNYRRAKYWLARTSGKLGNKEEEEKLLREMAYNYPASFYGSMSASRLLFQEKELDLPKKKEAKTFIIKKSYIPETYWISVLYLSGKESDVRKFIILFKQRIMDIGSESDKLMMSYISKKVGLSNQASAFIKSIPHISEKARQYIKLQYPINFEPEIASHGDFYNVPPLFVFSIARQESLFNTSAVSSAFAIGLLQLMPTTAQILANQEHYGKVTTANLKKPLTNIRFGVKFLGSLLNKFDRSLPLAAAGYNAGPGRVRKWIKKDPDAEIDEFIEDIPVFQTRNYVKKVMKNYAIYHYLYKGSVYSGLKFKLPKK